MSCLSLKYKIIYIKYKEELRGLSHIRRKRGIGRRNLRVVKRGKVK